MGHHHLKTVQKHLFLASHMVYDHFLRKVSFLPLLDPVDPFGHPPVWA